MWLSVSKVRRGGAVVGLDDVGSIIIDLIREGRRLLTNTYQVTCCCCVVGDCSGGGGGGWWWWWLVVVVLALFMLIR